MSNINKIRFQEEEYLLIGGVIAKEDDYRHGRRSYAHLFPDGRILRFGGQIGTWDDIEFLCNAEDMEFADDVLFNMLFSHWGP